VNAKNQLIRILCSEEMARSAEERLGFWKQLRGIAGELDKVDIDAVVNQAKAEMAQRLSSTLLSLSSSGDVSALADTVSAGAAPAAASGGGNGASAAAGDYEPVWVETPECTACDECTDLAPKIFAYNADKQVEVVNPQGGSYKDIVKAAEKCTAGCIHPGTPWNMHEKGVDKLIKRAEKYQ